MTTSFQTRVDRGLSLLTRVSRVGWMLVCAMTVLLPQSGQAQVATWTGNVSSSWSGTNNWSTRPQTTGTWGLVFGGSQQTTSTNDIGTISVSSLQFTNDGSTGKTAVFTLSGSTLAFNSTTITTSATTAGSLANADGDTLAMPLSLAGANSVTLGAGHSITMTGTISGGGSLSFASAGGSPYGYITGDNSFSGGMTVTGGLVQNSLRTGNTVASNTAFGTGGVAVSGSGSVVVRNNSTVGNAFTIAGTGMTSSSGVKLGALRGSFGAINQTATVSGAVSLSADALITAASTSGSNSTFGLSGPVNLGANRLTLAPNLAGGTSPLGISVSGSIGGTGGLIVSGSGASVVTLSAANGYSGGTRLTSGILKVGNASALGTGTAAVDGGTLDLNGQSLLIGALSGSNGGVITSTVAGPASLTTDFTGNSTYAGTITDGAGGLGIVSLLKTGTGTLHLTGSNGYTGGTTVSAGIVQNGSQTGQDFQNDAFGTGKVTVGGGGTVRLRNNSTIANNFDIAGTGAVANGVSLGALRGSFGTGNQTATVTGTVSLTANALITAAASTSGSNGKLQLSGPVKLGGNTLTFTPGLATGTSAVPIAVVGNIDGTGGLIVDGRGSVFLNGINTYTGSTNVVNGTLGGNGTGVSDVTVQAGATIDPGSDLNTTGSLGVGSLTLGSGATAAMAISGTSAGAFDQIVSLRSVAFDGTLSVNFLNNGFADGDSWQLFSGSSFSGNFASVLGKGAYGTLAFTSKAFGKWEADLGGGLAAAFYTTDYYASAGKYTAGQLVVVPEPSAFVIGGIGLITLGYGRLRRRRQARVI